MVSDGDVIDSIHSYVPLRHPYCSLFLRESRPVFSQMRPHELNNAGGAFSALFTGETLRTGREIPCSPSMREASKIGRCPTQLERAIFFECGESPPLPTVTNS